MNLIFRLIRVVVCALLARTRLGMDGRSQLWFRVWPTDLDLNLHLTNSRYLALMDLGRTDLLIRSGLGHLMIKQRWAAVVGAVQIRFRRSLKPWRKFDLTSEVIWWDDKFIYMDQRLSSAGELYASALVKGAFKAKGRVVPPAEIAVMLGHSDRPAAMPDAVRALADSVEAQRQMVA